MNFIGMAIWTQTLTGTKPITRPHFEIAVRQLGILDALAAYGPQIAGTPPLGVETEKSDIDILCHAPQADAFLADVVALYGEISSFRVWQWISDDRPVIATFHAHDWDFEIFASPCPVAAQYGWRHFQIEKRLLALGGARFKTTVQLLKQQGLKTEPAFWSALKQEGDGYQGLLSLDAATDDELRQMLAKAEFDPDAVSGL
ncbi:MAG: DUF4269 domain-containing protein [Rhizobium sp.]|nr:DUF4269 domain-containing protein [Rhizobium sp.]